MTKMVLMVIIACGGTAGNGGCGVSVTRVPEVSCARATEEMARVMPWIDVACLPEE